MKTLRFTLLLVTGLITWNLVSGQTGSAEQLTVPLSSPGKPYTLKVNIVSGSIKVSGNESKEILINVTSKESDEEKEKSSENGMKRISTSGGYEVTAKEADNVVTVHTGNPNKAIDLDLKIPQDVKLYLGTVNDGEILVENIKGVIEANNVNDKITLLNISGTVVANTVNGDVTATFTSVDQGAPMAFSTLNGDVNVTFPSDTKANLKLKSNQGDVLSDFDIEIDKTHSKVEKVTQPGMYKITKDDWVYGKINGGGPEIMMKTMTGDVKVKKAGK